MAMCSQIEIAIRIRLARSGLSTEQRIQRAELHEDLVESFWANNGQTGSWRPEVIGR
jgi:hypothetical protein